MASGFRPLNADGDAGTPTDSCRGRPRRPYPRKTYHHLLETHFDSINTNWKSDSR